MRLGESYNTDKIVSWSWCECEWVGKRIVELDARSCLGLTPRQKWDHCADLSRSDFSGFADLVKNITVRQVNEHCVQTGLRNVRGFIKKPLLYLFVNVRCLNHRNM